MKALRILPLAFSLLTGCASKPADPPSGAYEAYGAYVERQEIAALRQRFQARHPDIKVNDEFLRMGVEYGVDLGLDLDSSSGRAQLDRELEPVMTASPDVISPLWLFRSTFHVTTLMNALTQTNYGIATVSQTQDAVTIVCHSRKAHIKFDGVCKDGRLSGQVSVSAGEVNYNGRAEGVLVPNRISLDCQGETAAEMGRGSFVFLR